MSGQDPVGAEFFRHIPCLCGALRTATRAVTRVYDEELRPAGIRITQYSLLRILDAVGPLPQSQLAERLAAEKTTMSRSLQLVTSKGWTRVLPGQDRRERIIEITQRGRAQLAKSAPHWERAQDRLRDALGETRWRALRDVLPASTEAALRA